MFYAKFLFVMILVALADICWTMYFIETGKRNALKAATWSSLIMLCGSYSAISYVEDHHYILAVMIGSFAGTYFILKWKKDL